MFWPFYKITLKRRLEETRKIIVDFLISASSYTPSGQEALKVVLQRIIDVLDDVKLTRGNLLKISGDISARDRAYLMLRIELEELLSSGRYHIYRGSLGSTGLELFFLLRKVHMALYVFGIQEESEMEEYIDSVQDQINEVG